MIFRPLLCLMTGLTHFLASGACAHVLCRPPEHAQIPLGKHPPLGAQKSRAQVQATEPDVLSGRLALVGNGPQDCVLAPSLKKGAHGCHLLQLPGR